MGDFLTIGTAADSISVSFSGDLGASLTNRLMEANSGGDGGELTAAITLSSRGGYLCFGAKVEAPNGVTRKENEAGSSAAAGAASRRQIISSVAAQRTA